MANLSLHPLRGELYKENVFLKGPSGRCPLFPSALISILRSGDRRLSFFPAASSQTFPGAAGSPAGGSRRVAGRAAHCAPPPRGSGPWDSAESAESVSSCATPRRAAAVVESGPRRRRPPRSSLGVRGGHGHGHPGQARLQQPHGRRRSSARPVAPAQPLAGP